MKRILFFVPCFVFFNTFAQATFKIKGTIGNAKEKEIHLVGFKGTKDLLLFKTKTDSVGNFVINYPKNYIGAASLQVKESASLIVLLNQENFSLTWPDCKNFNSLQFTHSEENDWFQKAYQINLEVQIAAENSFLELQFNDRNLYHSGLIKDFFDEYLKQILKQQNKVDILSQLNSLSDKVKKKTTDSPLLLYEYGEYLIQHYEQYGLSEAAEKLGLLLLNDNQCSIDNKRLPILEQYRKMAVGNDAPALKLSNTTKKMSFKDIKSKYKIIVFGASWCEQCTHEIPQFKEYGEPFKTKYDAELIFVSLDSNKEKYKEFVKDLPFISSCDFKGWEGENIKNWHVFASPTIYILNDQNKIVAKPLNSIATAKWLFENVN